MDYFVRRLLTYGTRRRRYLIALLVGCCSSLLVGGLTAYFALESSPLRAHVNWPELLPKTGQTHSSTATSLAPFVDLVPSQDGTTITVIAHNISSTLDLFYANVALGPGHPKHSYAMRSSEQGQRQDVTIAGLSPMMPTIAGTLQITTAAGLDTGSVNFTRRFVPIERTTPQYQIYTEDGKLQVTFVTTDTIPFSTYVAVTPSFGAPAPPPSEHNQIGKVYSIRAPDSVPTTTQSMLLDIHYDEATLAGASPHTLALFRWDGSTRTWINIGGRLYESEKKLSVATHLFGPYALMTTPTWRDQFTTGHGIGQSDNVATGIHEDNLTLILTNTPGSGHIVSVPIVRPASAMLWGTMTFSAASHPPTTTLTIDLLDSNDAPLLSNVPNEIDLSDIDPAQHPSLKLRANFISTKAGETPALHAWQVTWLPGGVEDTQFSVYVPFVQR